jgi:hypothetical protein
MRWFAFSLVLGAVVIVLASSSCDSSRSACTSAHGACLYAPGAAVCPVSAPSSAQDCSTAANQGGWVCCLLTPEAELDAAAEGGSETPTVDASGDASADGSSDGASFAEAGDATGGEEVGTPDQDANDQ